MKIGLILFGVSGSGKGTLARLVTNQYSQALHFDCGHELRRDPEMNKLADAGIIVSDGTMLPFFDRLAPAATDFLIMDGFPRSIPQTHYVLRRCVTEHRTIATVFTELSEEIALERLKARAQQEARNDDKKKGIIETRFEKFRGYGPPIRRILQDRSDFSIRIDMSGTQEENARKFRAFLEKVIRHATDCAMTETRRARLRLEANRRQTLVPIPRQLGRGATTV